MDVADTMPFEVDLGLANVPEMEPAPLPDEPPLRFADMKMLWDPTLELPGRSTNDGKARGTKQVSSKFILGSPKTTTEFCFFVLGLVEGKMWSPIKKNKHGGCLLRTRAPKAKFSDVTPVVSTPHDSQ